MGRGMGMGRGVGMGGGMGRGMSQVPANVNNMAASAVFSSFRTVPFIALNMCSLSSSFSRLYSLSSFIGACSIQCAFTLTYTSLFTYPWFVSDIILSTSPGISAVSAPNFGV